jgi:hypothetical protein
LKQGPDAPQSLQQQQWIRRALPVLRADRGKRAAPRQMRGRLNTAISGNDPAPCRRL